MNALKGRLRRLEEAARGGACAECGLPQGGPNYTIDRGEPLPENPDEGCPRCGRRLWWVCEIEVPKAQERHRAFAEEVMRRDWEMLDENRAALAALGVRVGAGAGARVRSRGGGG